MSSPKRRQRNEYRLDIRRAVSQEEIEGARSQIAAGITFDPEKWEAFLDFVEQDFYGLVTPKFDPETAAFDCLPLPERERFVERYGEEPLDATPEAFLFACRDIAGGTEAHDRYMAQYELEVKRGQQEAFAFFDMFSQGRNLGKLPPPTYVISLIFAVIRRGNDFLRWLGVHAPFAPPIIPASMIEMRSADGRRWVVAAD